MDSTITAAFLAGVQPDGRRVAVRSVMVLRSYMSEFALASETSESAIDGPSSARSPALSAPSRYLVKAMYSCAVSCKGASTPDSTKRAATNALLSFPSRIDANADHSTCRPPLSRCTRNWPPLE